MTNRTWTMILNWARVIAQTEADTSLTPAQAEIEQALTAVEQDANEEALMMKEAEELEQMIVIQLTKIIRKNRGREMKKVKEIKEREKADLKSDDGSNVDVQIFGPFGNMGSLKDMGFDIDPEMLKQMSGNMMEKMAGKKVTKKKRNSDDEEDEDNTEDDRGSSFYM